MLLDRCSVKDLQNVFPTLLDNIFGTTGGVSWGIRNITLNNTEFETVHHFLAPLGPVFRLIYRLLDSTIKYEYNSSYLPVRGKKC